MKSPLLVVLSLVAALAGRPAAAAIDQTLWLDASDASSLVLNGNIVQTWLDKTSHHNDLHWIQGSPQVSQGGVELVERTNGLTDRLEGTATLSPRGEAFLMILVCHPYLEAVRLFSTAGNNMSLRQQGSFGDNRLGLQIDNNCELPYPVAGIGTRQIYVMTRTPNGTGSDVALKRFGGPELSASLACPPEELFWLRFDNGSGSFPTNSQKGMTVFEAMAFTAPVAAQAARGLQPASSPFDAAFIDATVNSLAVKWNVNQPVPVQTTTWGRIKLLSQ